MLQSDHCDALRSRRTPNHKLNTIQWTQVWAFWPALSGEPGPPDSPRWARLLVAAIVELLRTVSTWRIVHSYGVFPPHSSPPAVGPGPSISPPAASPKLRAEPSRARVLPCVCVRSPCVCVCASVRVCARALGGLARSCAVPSPPSASPSPIASAAPTSACVPAAHLPPSPVISPHLP